MVYNSCAICQEKVLACYCSECVKNVYEKLDKGGKLVCYLEQAGYKLGRKQRTMKMINGNNRTLQSR